MEALADNQLAALVGMIGGLGLGLAAAIGQFCTLGAIEDTLYGQDKKRLRMWGLAIAVAITGVFVLNAFGMVEYAGSRFFIYKFNVISAVLGGLTFGWGMALAGSCGFGALSRMAGGDMRSFIVATVMGISAYMMIGGPTAALREWLFPSTLIEAGAQPQGIADLLAATFGVPALVPALAIAALLAIWAFWDKGFRTSRSHIIWSAIVGLSIISGWWGTTYIAQNGFGGAEIESHSFSAPLGETLVYIMTWTGAAMNFGTGSVAGVLIGSLVGTRIKGRFRWEACDDAREMGRSVFGAFLMGTGGVLAIGCSVGQGLTGFSALSYSAPIVLGAIFVGAALGLKYLIHGFQRT